MFCGVSLRAPCFETVLAEHSSLGANPPGRHLENDDLPLYYTR